MIRLMESIYFASVLDLNMGYHHTKLEADAQKLCTICIPMTYRKVQIQTLTHEYQDWMDPDVFQNFMSKLVQDMEYIKTNILYL
jgi:hypothetical protein